MNSSRRSFIHQMGIISLSSVLPFQLVSCKSKNSISTDKLSSFKFGLMADPHADLIPDKNARLSKFIERAINDDVQFIIQLGDFCFPKKENLDFLNIWNQFKGPNYHVLGNHDMDISSKEVIMEYLEMPSKYYSFDEEGFHFVVLDANYIYNNEKYLDYNNANFYIDSSLRTFINPEQIEWLKGDLESTNKPTIIFSHQSLLNALWGIKNRLELREVLEQENIRSGFQKVIACFNGHDHIDYHKQINGIHYVEVNSMSYQWLGEKYSNKTRYSAELYDKYQSLDKLAPYKDALYTIISVDPHKGRIELEGLKSEWIEPSPANQGVPLQVPGNRYTPEISDRKLAYS